MLKSTNIASKGKIFFERNHSPFTMAAKENDHAGETPVKRGTLGDMGTLQCVIFSLSRF